MAGSILGLSRDDGVVIRSDGEPMALAPAVRRAVAEIDRGKPAGNIRTVEQYLGQQSRGLELYATLLGIFGAAAGLLAALGIYGVMAYTIAQRTREIGIRMALGAGGTRVMRLVMLRAVILIGIGLVLGLAGAMGLTEHLLRALRGQPDRSSDVHDCDDRTDGCRPGRVSDPDTTGRGRGPDGRAALRVTRRHPA